MEERERERGRGQRSSFICGIRALAQFPIFLVLNKWILNYLSFFYLKKKRALNYL